MPDRLTPFFYKELEIAGRYSSMNDFRSSWYHLERAHILGQPYPYHHTLVHWKMLLFGIRIKDICSTPHFSDHWLSLFPLTLSVPYENKKEKIFISFQG
jgi:hypothetical protein